MTPPWLANMMSFMTVGSACLGAIIGSFLNVCIDRLPRGESIVFPRSHCDHCGYRLQEKDLIPILSYIRLGGRCRTCGEAIPRRVLGVELVTAALYLALWLHWGWQGLTLLYALLCSVLVVVAFIDWKWLIIPNSLTLVGAGGALLGLFCRLGPSLGDALLGAAVGGGILQALAYFSLLVFRREGMGGGDVKLMAMVGLYLGWQQTLLALFLASFFGCILSLILILHKREKLTIAIPFGPFLSLGILVALFVGEKILDLYLGIFS